MQEEKKREKENKNECRVKERSINEAAKIPG